MVRRVLLFLAVGIGACAGRSTDGPATGSAGKADASGGTSGGDAGRGAAGAGGTGLTGGSAGDGAGRPASGGGGEGSGAMPGASGNNTVAGEGGAAGSAGGGGRAGGGAASFSGSGGSGAAGASAGEAGAAGECTEPNPAGCERNPCPDGQTCVLASGVCIPSSCTCVAGGWACTKDCGGGQCVSDSPCTTPNPSGCASDEHCAEGESCLAPADEACIPLGCSCVGATGEWSCLETCGGGECKTPDCPQGCEPSAEAFCDGDGVTWVCGFDGAFDAGELVENCTDLGTQIPRFCCPATFKPECRRD